MRRCPPPLRVTLPPPSSTRLGLVLRTFAVAFMVIVTGAGPQWNVTIPPAATAATTASEVQLAGVPAPITRVGWEVSTGRASAGTAACPFGLPKVGGGVDAGGLVEGSGAGGVLPPKPARALGAGPPLAADRAGPSPPQPPRQAAVAAASTAAISCRRGRTHRTLGRRTWCG